MPTREDLQGRLLELRDDAGNGAVAESWQHVAVTRIGDETRIEALRRRILGTLEDVRLAVTDWRDLRLAADEVRAGG